MNKVSSTTVASPKTVSRGQHGINLGFGGGIPETICLQNKSTVLAVHILKTCDFYSLAENHAVFSLSDHLTVIPGLELPFYINDL